MAEAGSALAGVLLAAGGSSRLGGASKQLLSLDGQPLVRRQAALLLQVCAPVVVVTGAVTSRVEAALDGLAVDIVHNPAWDDGMGGSLALAARSLGNASALMVLLADQWAVTREDLVALRTAARNNPGDAVAARWPGCPAGVPAIFPAALFGRLVALSGDVGARRILADPEVSVVGVELPGAAHDLDTPEDLAAFEAAQA